MRVVSRVRGDAEAVNALRSEMACVFEVLVIYVGWIWCGLLGTGRCGLLGGLLVQTLMGAHDPPPSAEPPSPRHRIQPHHLKHECGVVAEVAVPCTFSHVNSAGSPKMSVLVL